MKKRGGQNVFPSRHLAGLIIQSAWNKLFTVFLMFKKTPDIFLKRPDEAERHYRRAIASELHENPT